MQRYALGLGSSIGDRFQALELATAFLGASSQARLLRTSRVYETPAWEARAQGRFLNAAVSLEWAGSPEELLVLAKQCEIRLGRERGKHWGDRSLDVDILWAEGLQIQSPHLVVPHPLVHVRNFAIWPLVEVCPGAKDPAGVTYRQRLQQMRAPAAIGVLAC